jgi:xanthine dehydrogenase molybdopterin-binding subunit B
MLLDLKKNVFFCLYVHMYRSSLDIPIEFNVSFINKPNTSKFGVLESKATGEPAYV